jgi:hypothetical protein
MKEFLLHHSYIVIWICALVIVGSGAELTIQLSQVFLNPPTPSRVATIPSIPEVPVPQGPPSVTFTIQKTSNGNSFLLQWQNLPNGTVALKIYRGKTGTDSSKWLLWKTIALSPSDLAKGMAEIALGKDAEIGFSFRLEAIGNNGDGGKDATSSAPILWESSSTVPFVTTSTVPVIPPSDNGGGGNPPPPANPTGTNPNTPQNPPVTPSSSSDGPTSNNTPTPSGTPYYSPQVQITGYSSGPTGNFWVQSASHRIQIGWQDLPAETTNLVVLRSDSQSGPWTSVLSQENPSTSGSYSLQIIDSTVGKPFYYEMRAYQSSNTNITYGPVYVAD